MIMSSKQYYTAILSTCVLLLGTTASVRAADKCVPIPLVGGEGNTVTKRVSGPTIPGPLPGVDITRNNWNTDWYVRGGSKRYRYFKATINSKEGKKNLMLGSSLNIVTRQVANFLTRA